MEKLRDNKRQQLEKLHNMKLEDFGMRIYL